ncbi:MAG: Uma2 family endonuclease [Dehalococcoidia bacterium]|nr:Uma2 family endonuclease [Dehalococcoidia bacterium]
MTTVPKLMTSEEFQRLPEPAGGERMELVQGVVVMTPPPTAGHGERAFEIGVAVRDFVRRHRLGLTSGEGGYRLRRDPDTVRAPDAAWIAFDRIPGGAFPEDDYPDAAPNLAIEVMSSHDREMDIDEKVADYLSAGCERVWVVRPRQRTITVYRPDGNAHRFVVGDTLTSDDAGFPVDGFQLPVARVFE